MQAFFPLPPWLVSPNAGLGCFDFDLSWQWEPSPGSLLGYTQQVFGKTLLNGWVNANGAPFPFAWSDTVLSSFQTHLSSL